MIVMQVCGLPLQTGQKKLERLIRELLDTCPGEGYIVMVRDLAKKDLGKEFVVLISSDDEAVSKVTRQKVEEVIQYHFRKAIMVKTQVLATL